MRALNKKILNKLNKIYNPMSVILDGEVLHNSDKYNFNCFSVFNHRLINEEAEKQILFYQHALDDGDTLLAKQYCHFSKLSSADYQRAVQQNNNNKTQ